MAYIDIGARLIELEARIVALENEASDKAGDAEYHAMVEKRVTTARIMKYACELLEALKVCLNALLSGDDSEKSKAIYAARKAIFRVEKEDDDAVKGV